MPRIRYSQETKRQAVRLVLEEHVTPAVTAKQIGCNPITVQKWVRNGQNDRRTLRNRKEVENAGIKLRYALRQKESLPQLDCIFVRAHDKIGKYTDKELLGLAYRYLLNHETPLRRYSEDGRLEIDYNSCELVLRPMSIGRKNWLFFRNERGGKTDAIIFTICEVRNFTT